MGWEVQSSITADETMSAARFLVALVKSTKKILLLQDGLNGSNHTTRDSS